ncbi:MAG: cytochrome B [Kordiimonadales bacterium]|nr:MAG: cytochrome B [Kordiimonadales bacterium]
MKNNAANTKQSGYTLVAMTLHWVLAALITSQFLVGPVMTRLSDADADLQFTLYQFHKSIGITILILMGIRLVWRILHKPPALPEDFPATIVTVSKVVHGTLYALVIILCLVGWSLVSASPYNIPTVLFGEVVWPHIWFMEQLTDKQAAETALKAVHTYGAYVLLTLVTLHTFAALYHQFYRKDGLIGRMLPFAPRAPSAPNPAKEKG